MIVNSKNRYTVVALLYAVSAIFILLDVIALNVSGTFGRDTVYFSPVVLGVALFLMHLGKPVFFYDSDGEVFIVKSYEPILKGFGDAFKLHFEMPKNHLVGYEIKRILLRRQMNLAFETESGTVRKFKVPISYLTPGEVNRLKTSLDKALVKNQKHKH